MRNIERFNKKSKKIISKIRNDLSELIKVNEDNNEKLNKLKTHVENVHFELKKIDSVFIGDKDKENLKNIDALIEDDNLEDTEDISIKKQIIIRRRKKIARSFSRWLFSNKDV